MVLYVGGNVGVLSWLSATQATGCSSTSPQPHSLLLLCSSSNAVCAVRQLVCVYLYKGDHCAAHHARPRVEQRARREREHHLPGLLRLLRAGDRAYKIVQVRHSCGPRSEQSQQQQQEEEAHDQAPMRVMMMVTSQMTLTTLPTTVYCPQQHTTYPHQQQ